jgi:hypothetical protein
MGQAGRRRFEDQFSWDVIVERHYRPLLKRREAAAGRDGPLTRPSGTLSPLARGEGEFGPLIRPAATLTPPGGVRGTGAFIPEFPVAVDRDRLLDDAGRFFDLGRDEVERQWRVYRAFHDAKGYERALGEFKTLCLEEAFVLCLALGLVRPATIVEIGTQHGRSTRRILDMIGLLGLESRVVCFDVADDVRYFKPGEEAKLILGDLTGRFRRDVLEAYEPGLIYLDVHTDGLLFEAVTETLAHPAAGVLAIHDCGRGLCNPRMTIAREDSQVTSLTGVWERHILAEVFGIDDPRSERLDVAESPTHRLAIFATRHGLGVVRPTVPR